VAEVEHALRAEAKAGAPPPIDALGTGEPLYPAPSEELTNEIGDLLFAVVNLARKAHVAPAAALDHANRKFRSRFERVEALAAARGIDVATAGLEVLDGLWEEVKRTGD
jgi:uncharacterized protein YabN with tetrapyrrole methylase and pyrophosphatase domain